MEQQAVAAIGGLENLMDAEEAACNLDPLKAPRPPQFSDDEGDQHETENCAGLRRRSNISATSPIRATWNMSWSGERQADIEDKASDGKCCRD